MEFLYIYKYIVFLYIHTVYIYTVYIFVLYLSSSVKGMLRHLNFIDHVFDGIATPD